MIIFKNMHYNTIIAIFLIALILGSLYTVTHTLSISANYLIPTSISRLQSFIICHIVAIGFMIRFMIVPEGKEQTKWAFQLTTTLCLIMTLTEAYNAIKQNGMVDIVVESMEVNESFCISLYWLIFVYSFIAALITGLLLCSSFVGERIQ